MSIAPDLFHDYRIDIVCESSGEDTLLTIYDEESVDEGDRKCEYTPSKEKW